MYVENKLYKVKCFELTYQGLGVVLVKNKRFFVPNLFVDEVAEIKIIQENKNYGYGEIVNLITRSLKRTNNLLSFNSYSLINLDYQEQINWKNQYLKKLFGWNLNINLKNIKEIIFDQNNFYRNKVKYPLFVDINDNFLKLGEYQIKSKKLLLANNLSQNFVSINNFLKYFLEQANNYFKKDLQKLNFFSWISVRSNIDNHLQVSIGIYNDFDLPKKFIEKLKEYNLIVELFVVKNNIYKEIFKKAPFFMKIFNKKFIINPENFFQINLKIFEKILEKLNFLIKDTNLNIFIDGYCGVGVFSQTLNLDKNTKIIGIELQKQAIELAKINANLNKTKNFYYFSGKIEKIVKNYDLKFYNGAIIVDPPRSGLNIEVINWIDKMQFKNIFYLSCDPRTLLRDLKEFEKLNYLFEEIQPYDMFPNTHHIETLVKISKK